MKLIESFEADPAVLKKDIIRWGREFPIQSTIESFHLRINRLVENPLAQQDISHSHNCQGVRTNAPGSPTALAEGQ